MHAQGRGGNAAPDLANPVVLIIILGVLTLAPFLAMMMTSFVKVAMVLSMVRSGLGTQVPPGIVTNGLAIILTIFIMAPVASEMYRQSDIEHMPASSSVFSTDNFTTAFKAAAKGKEPLRLFLLRHAHPEDRALFVGLRQRLEQGQQIRQQGSAPAAPVPPTPASPPADQSGVRPDEEFSIVLPAFVTSELKGAFQIGFLVLLPFVVVDLVIANVMVAMGLQMINPAVVSLPLKILLFVAADGWYLLVKGLVLGYA
jgi:type III secretion protein R